MTQAAEAARWVAWHRGYLRHILRTAQVWMYDFIHEFKRKNPLSPGPLVINAHRGSGKTFGLLGIGWERCLRFPGQAVRYGSDTEEKVREFVEPNIEKICDLSPPGLVPVRRGNTLYFRNPQWGPRAKRSTLTFFGCRENAKRQRGFRSDLVILDEAGIISGLTTIVESVITGHFLGRRHLPLLILGSTPPQNAQHPFSTRYVYHAKREGRYLKIRGSDNPDFDQQEQQVMLSVCKSRESAAWLREVECDETISNLESLAVPEWRKVKERCVFGPKCGNPAPIRPRFFYPLVAMDFGFFDFNAVVFGYINYSTKKLVIERELVTRKVTTGELADGIKSIEAYLWDGDFQSPHPRAFHRASTRRWGDNDLQELHDLKKTYGVHVLPAEKWDRAAALGALCTKVAEERVLISEDCPDLIAQLDHGALNEKRTDFERYPVEAEPDAPIMGHLDALVALMYLVRMAENYWFLNPIPQNWADRARQIGPDQMLNPGYVPPKPTAPKRGGIDITRTHIPITRRRIH